MSSCAATQLTGTLTVSCAHNCQSTIGSLFGKQIEGHHSSGDPVAVVERVDWLCGDGDLVTGSQFTPFTWPGRDELDNSHLQSVTVVIVPQQAHSNIMAL